MLLNGKRKRLGKYVRLLADEMGLRDWRFLISPHACDSGYSATVAITAGRRRATIAFDADWPYASAEDLRQTVAHELLHCHINPIRDYTANIESTIGKPLYNATYNAMTDLLELAVDAIAEEWARSLPLPE